MPPTVIVLVPGAYHRPSSWNLVAAPLRDQGFTVLTPALATAGDAANAASIAATTPLDDVKVIHDALAPHFDDGAEAILVSHSYGAVPVSLAVEGQTVDERKAKGLKGGVKGIVTIAGFAFPARGKNIFGGDDVPPPMPYAILKDGVTSLTEPAKALFYSDLAPAQQDAAWADLCEVHSRMSWTQFPDFITADITVPKVFVLTTEDECIPPSFQEMGIQAGVYDKVVKVKAGHSPMLSVPDEIVKILAEAAA